MSTAPPADDRDYPWKKEHYDDEDPQSGMSGSQSMSRSTTPSRPTSRSSRSSKDHGDGDSKDRPPRPPPPKNFKPTPTEKPDKQFGERAQDPKDSNFGFFYSVFGTRQLASRKNRETYIRVTIRELTIYIVYLAVICTITFGTTSSSTYFFTKIMRELFVDQELRGNTQRTFRVTTTIDDFWIFTNGPMLDGLYWEFLYNKRTILRSGEGRKDITKNGILFENKLIGAPRLRQIRVKPDSCEIAPNFRRLIRQCYAPYSEEHEDTTKKWAQHDGTAWQYFSQDELDGISYWGKLATYSGGGSYINLAVDAKMNPSFSAIDETKSAVEFLKTNRWITRATRVIFLDFTVYNANVNLFCIVKLVWEIPATGGVLTSWSLQTVKLLRYVNWFELYVILPCEVAFCIFTVYYLIQELLEMFHLGFRKYVGDVWSWVDLSILAFSFVCFGLSVHRHLVVAKFMQELDVDSTDYINFEKLGNLQLQYNNCLAVLIFVSWVKIFKYISFNTTMTQLSTTLSRCAGDVGGFAIMFFIVFGAFAQLGYLMFGSQVEDFSTFFDSVFTLLRLILGDFDFPQIERANRLLGPIFFIAYVFFVFFVLVNMFLAILTDTYGEVKAELQASQQEFEIADYFKRGFNNMRGWFGKKNEVLDAKYRAQLTSNEGQITYEELRKNLEDAHFSDVEIQMFLARYDIDHHRALDEDEIHHVLAELENERLHHGGRRKSFHDAMNSAGDAAQDNELFEEEIEALDKRVTTMEASLTGMMNKIDVMVQIMERIR